MNGRNRLYRLLSFLVPFAAVLISFIVNGMEPFGVNSILNGDAGAQYYPFLMMLRDTVREGESLLYTWRTGMGMSLVPMIAYYISSPLNLLCILLPDNCVMLYLLLAVCFRYGLAGWSFTVLAQTVKPKLTAAAPVFGWIFALCGWLLVSYWQLIWLDTVALTPLVLAGLIKAVRDHDYRLYPAALGLSLICNFYMGFLTCMMTGCCWIGLMIVLKKPLREIPKEAGKFIGLSVLSAAIGAVLFIPTLFVLGNSARAGSGSLDFTQFYETVPELLGQFASFCFPIVNAHPPNLQSSMLVLMLPLLFLTQKRIALRERLFCTVLALFLLFSLWYAPLNFVWHGFHFPGATVDRFAYLVPLVLAYIGWRFTDSLTDEQIPFRKQIPQILLMLPLPVIVLVCAAKAEATDIPLVSAVFCAAYVLLWGFRMSRPQKKTVFAVALAFTAGLELSLNSYSYIMRKANVSALTVIHEPVSSAADVIRSQQQEKQIVRTAVGADNEYCNKELLYDLPFGSSSFNSLNTKALQTLCSLLGYRYPVDGCYYGWDELPLFSSQLLNIQYAVADHALPGCTALTAVPEKDLDDESREVQAAAFVSDYPTAPGFCIPDDVPVAEQDELQIMDVQNRLFRSLTGIETPLSEVILPELTEQSDVTIQQNGEQYQIHAEKAAEGAEPTKPHIVQNLRTDKDGIYYVCFYYDTKYDDIPEAGAMELKQSTFYVNGEKRAQKDFYTLIPVKRMMIPLGYLEVDSELEMTHRFFAGTDPSFTVQVYCLDEDIFREGYEKLMRSAFTVTDFAESRLTGTVDAEADSLLYLSIPYDKGWKAEVDGQPAEIIPALDAMTGIRLTKGTHTVTLRFFPRGLAAGAAVSVAALTVYAVLLIMQARRKRERSKEKAHADA